MNKLNISHDFYKLNGFDVVLITAVLCISIGVFLFTGMGLNWRIAEAAEGFVFNNGTLVKSLDINQNGTFPLLDGKMIIEINNRRIRVIESDCHQKICMNTGWINTPGQIIACVPNTILIEINSGDKPFLDAVVH